MKTSYKPASVADAPIAHPKEDELGRKEFAKALASAIARHKIGECLVTALCGSWGDGKTSTANLAISYLPKCEDGGLKIIRFNPWQLSDHAELTNEFFKALTPAFKSADPEATKRRGILWRGLQTLAATAKHASKIASESIDDPIGKAIAAAVGLAAGVTENAAEDATKYLSSVEPTLFGIKKALVDELSKAKERSLIVIDDVDRLTDEEIVTLFRVVKSNADLPNLQYLLLFQTESVERALGGVTNGQGREFLEKIVQVSVNLPVPEEARIGRIVGREMSRLLKDRRVSAAFEDQRWNELYQEAFKKFLTNVRRIKRFFWSFEFRLNSFLGGRVSEVNVVDLFALEILRVFEPSFSNRIWANRDLLLETPAQKYGHFLALHLHGDKTPSEQQKAQFEQLMGFASVSHVEWVRLIMAAIFPITVWFGGGRRSESFQYASFRIGDGRHFAKYFIEQTPAGTLSHRRIAEILNACRDARKLRAKLSLVRKEGLEEVFIRTIADFLERMPPQNVSVFAQEMIDFGEKIPGDDFRRSLSDSVAEIIEEALKKLPDADSRAQALVSAIQNAAHVFIGAKLAAFEAYRQGSEGTYPSFLETAENLNAVRMAVSRRIIDLSERKLLGREVHLSRLIAYWIRVDLVSAKSWAEKVVAANGALSLLEMFVSPVDLERTDPAYYRLDLEAAAALINLEELYVSVDQLRQSATTPKGLITAKLFEKNLPRRKDQKRGFIMTFDGREELDF